MGERPLPAGFVPDGPVGFIPDAPVSRMGQAGQALNEMAAAYRDPQKVQEGLLLGGIGPAASEIGAALTKGGKALEVAKTIGLGALGSGLTYGAQKMGIPSYVSGPLLIAAGLKSGMLSPAAEEAAATTNTGGRLVTSKAPSIDQSITDALTELRQPSKPNAISLPPQAELPPGYTPRSSTAPLRIVGSKVAVPSPSGAAAVEAAAPQTVTTAQPQTYVQQQAAKLQAPTPADLPRSWHAFMDPSSRAAGDEPTLSQASTLHRELADMDQRYKASTVNEREMFRRALMQALGGGS